jgi:hypothetical protein
VTESPVTLPADPRRSIMFSCSRPPYQICETSTMLARPIWISHPHIRAPCVPRRSSDCGRISRPFQISQDKRVALRATATADVGANSYFLTGCSIEGLKYTALWKLAAPHRYVQRCGALDRPLCGRPRRRIWHTRVHFPAVVRTSRTPPLA